MRMLRSGELEGAEKTLEQLVLGEPENHDGYEGLALVYQHKGPIDANRTNYFIEFLESLLRTSEKASNSGKKFRKSP
jgi:hypothetical protein